MLDKRKNMNKTWGKDPICGKSPNEKRLENVVRVRLRVRNGKKWEPEQSD